MDRKVSSPATRFLLMSVSVFFLLLAVVGWDVISSQMAKADMEKQLEEQKQIAAELESVMKEQKELEDKIASIDKRIEAIKKLRAEQAGPSAVLEALRERIAMVPGLYLQSVEQAGDQMTIKGNSPDESAVTQFGRSLEFSNGLFSNLNIETVRQEVTNQMASASKTGEAAKINLVNFTIKTAYTPSKANQGTNALPTQASAASSQPAQNAQPVKN
jgi:Tfp pilus assembly protein PilN